MREQQIDRKEIAFCELFSSKQIQRIYWKLINSVPTVFSHIKLCRFTAHMCGHLMILISFLRRLEIRRRGVPIRRKSANWPKSHPLASKILINSSIFLHRCLSYVKIVALDLAKRILRLVGIRTTVTFKLRQFATSKRVHNGMNQCYNCQELHIRNAI